jgi:hypothetical protein
MNKNGTTQVVTASGVTTQVAESGTVEIYMNGQLLAEVYNTDSRTVEVG